MQCIHAAGAPLARGSCRDRDPIRALFLRPGSGSQLFLGLSGSNLWFPGGSELNCAAPGPRTTTNLTTCPVRVLNYKSQQPPSKPRSFNSYVHVSSFIFFSADKIFWTGPCSSSPDSALWRMCRWIVVSRHHHIVSLMISTPPRLPTTAILPLHEPSEPCRMSARRREAASSVSGSRHRRQSAYELCFKGSSPPLIIPCFAIE